HALPEAGRRGRGDRDAPLLLLLHPVHGRSAVVHLADLVVHAGVIEDALGRRRLAGVDVSRDTDIAVALDRGLAGHDVTPNTGAARGLEVTRRAAEGKRWWAGLRSGSARRPCWPRPCGALRRASSSRRHGLRPLPAARWPGA